MRYTWLQPLLSWLLGVLLITALSGLVYIAVQFDLRSGANEQQAEMAQDVEERLHSGNNPSLVLTQEKVNISTSLKPWVAIYDAQGSPVVSTGELDGQIPTLPQGVLSHDTEANYTFAGESRITWQPNPHVRQALIIRTTNDYYIVAGRSLKEIEERISTLGKIVVITWGVILFCLSIFSLIKFWILKRNTHLE